MVRTAILAAGFLLAALFGGIWLGGHPSSLPEPIRDAFVDDSQAQLYQEAVDLIEDDYYREVDPDKLLDKSLESAVSSLDDRFSAYFDAESFQKFQETTNGEFEGVGMTVQEVKRGLQIVKIFDNSPAKNAGLRAGDVITEVNGRKIAGQTSEQATTRIKGKAGTAVSLTWERKGKRTTKRLQRARVDVPIVDAKIVRGPGGTKVGHVTLAGFSAGAHAQVAQGIRRVRARGAKAIVFDMRANGGGLLNEAVLVSSLFVRDGKIVSTKGRSRPEKVYEATGSPVYADGPLVVLVDRGSASASEIVAGALQDHKRAKLVGDRTFGKGVFQEVKQLENGGALDITVGEYFTPKGRNLGGGGVKVGRGLAPDIKARDKPSTRKRDEGLDRAVEVVVGQARGR